MAPHSLILLQNKGHFKETKPKHLLGFVRHLYSDLKWQCYISSWVFFFLKWKENLGKSETYLGKSCHFTKKKHLQKRLFRTQWEPYVSGTTELHL